MYTKDQAGIRNLQSFVQNPCPDIWKCIMQNIEIIGLPNENWLKCCVEYNIMSEKYGKWMIGSKPIQTVEHD